MGKKNYSRAQGSLGKIPYFMVPEKTMKSTIWASYCSRYKKLYLLKIGDLVQHSALKKYKCNIKNHKSIPSSLIGLKVSHINLNEIPNEFTRILTYCNY